MQLTVHAIKEFWLFADGAAIMATAINRLVLKFILSEWRSWLKCTLVGGLRNDRIATTDSRGRRVSSKDPVTR